MKNTINVVSAVVCTILRWRAAIFIDSFKDAFYTFWKLYNVLKLKDDCKLQMAVLL